MPNVQVLTDQSFPAFIQSEKPVMVDFWAVWCGPCKMLSPVVEEIAGELGGRMGFGKLNVDENPQMASKYGIMSIPTLLVFQKGKVVRQIIGYVPKKQLMSKISDLVG